MLSKNIIFKNGHLYDKATQNRIILQEGAEFCIVGEDHSFKTPQPAGNEIKNLKTSERIKTELEALVNIKEVTNYKKVLPSGTFFVF